MFDKAFELTTKALVGEELSDEEKKYLRERNARYELVRYIYTEKINSGEGFRGEGHKLINFQFTPGESFDKTPIFDIVDSLLKVNKELKNAEPMTFGDSNKYGNPPHTGMAKRTLGGIENASMDPQE